VETFLVIATVILAAGLAFTFWQLNELRNKYSSFLKGGESKTIEQLLKSYSSEVKDVNRKLDALAGFSAQLHKTTALSLTRVGFVRFNPFDDTGGDQSFCLALIDSSETGFVLSSIHARTGTRMYAKEIISGKSTHHLSDEEALALTKATTQKLPLPKV